VPADLLTQWLAQHCFVCGGDTARLEQQWRDLNKEWAEEATPDALEHWCERLGVNYDEVKKRIANGLLCDTPPMYTIQPTLNTALGGEADTYHICGTCFGDMFDDVFENGERQVKDIKTHMVLLAIVKALKINIE